MEATAKVAQTLFQMATSGHNTAASIFWMKARAGWREKHEVTIRPERPVREIPDEELERLARRGLADFADELQERRIEHKRIRQES